MMIEKRLHSRIWCSCANCNKPIYIGDDIWKVSDMVFCDHCVRGGVAGDTE